jgi:hypothetical protein
MIGDKKFLPAAVMLVRSIKTVNKPEISQIGAVSELKAYFTSQESVGDSEKLMPDPPDSNRHLDRRATKPFVPQELLQRLALACICAKPTELCVA